MQINEEYYPLERTIGNTEITQTVTQVSADGELIEKSIFYAGCANEYLNRFDGINCVEYFNGGTGFTVQFHPQTEYTKTSLVTGYNSYWGSLVYNRSSHEPNTYHGEDITLVRKFNFEDIYIDMDNGQFITSSLENANKRVPYDYWTRAFNGDKKTYSVSDYINNELYNNGEPILGFNNFTIVQNGTSQRFTVAMCHDDEEINSTNYSTIAVNDVFRLTTFQNYNMTANAWNHFTCVESNWNNSGNSRCMLYKSPVQSQYPMRFGGFIFGDVSECEIDVLATREFNQTNNYYIPTDYDFSDKALPIIVYTSDNWAFELYFGYSFEYFMKIIASLGLRFKINNIMYVPEIGADGYTTGRYVKESELQASDFANKDWISTENSVYDADRPPGPTPSGGDDIDNIALNNLSGYGSAFTRYYIMTRDQLFDLRDWINSDEREPGYDALDNIISMYEFPYDVSQICTTAGASVIKIGSETYGAVFSDPVAELILTREKIIDAGSVTVPARYGNFLDYEPYTTASVYIPYCGVVDISLNYCAGKEIKAQIIADVLTGSCRGVITCGSVILATKAGQIGNEVVLTSDGVGRRHAALLSGLLATAGGIVGTAAAAASGNVTGSAAGGLAVLSGITKLEQAKNSSYSSHIGNASADVDYNLPASCYLLMTQPVSDIPSSYGHSEGFPCLRSEVFSSCEGYTVVSNADLSGISATAEELGEIKRYLESGVIVQYE